MFNIKLILLFSIIVFEIEVKLDQTLLLIRVKHQSYGISLSQHVHYDLLKILAYDQLCMDF